MIINNDYKSWKIIRNKYKYGYKEEKPIITTQASEWTISIWNQRMNLLELFIFK